MSIQPLTSEILENKNTTFPQKGRLLRDLFDKRNNKSKYSPTQGQLQDKLIEIDEDCSFNG
jgi:hypothetical protein